MNVRELLLENQDLKYRDFNSKLIPNVAKEKIIGVRVPVLRQIAKEAAEEKAHIGDDYFEEKMVRGLCIGYSKEPFEVKLKELDGFIPLIDNWAVCDSVCSSLKFTNKHKKEMWSYINMYLTHCDREFDVRFAVVMMMDYYIDDEYIDRVLSLLSQISSEYYYVNMAVAWALSVCYVKFPEKTYKLIEEKKLSTWVHNKTIQKIRESNRVDKQTKEMLKAMKI